MSVRPPQFYSSRETFSDPLSAALQHEILGEKASTLGRLQKKLETALSRLAAERVKLPTDTIAMARTLAEAREALWFVTIQRELCGLVRHVPYYDHMKVPMDVRLHMGPDVKK